VTPQEVGAANGVLKPFVQYGDRILFIDYFDGFHVCLEDPLLPPRTSAVMILEHQARQLSAPTILAVMEWLRKGNVALPERYEQRCHPKLIEAFLNAAKKSPAPSEDLDESPSVAKASASLDDLMRKAMGAAGCKDEAAFKRLPREEQNAFLAQARGAKLAGGRAADNSRPMLLVHIFRSATNREFFDDEKMKELVASVRAHGVMEPIIVRPVKAGEWFVDPGTHNRKEAYFVMSRGYAVHVNAMQPGEPATFWSSYVPPSFPTRAEAEANLPRFEIVMGERRYRAAKEVGLQEIPAIVRDLDDQAAVEWQLTENLMREDLRPVDEGRGFKQLLELGLSIEEIAAKVNVGKSTIYARMKLLELPPAALHLCEQGLLPASHAELLAKIEDPKKQEKLASEMLKPRETYSHGQMVKLDMSFREAKALVDEAGKREEKEKAWREKTADYREEGYQVLTLAQSGKVFQYGRLKSAYVGASDKCDLDPQGRTWKALLTKIGEEGKAIVAHDEYGSGNKVRVVYPRKTVEPLLIAGGLVNAKAVKISPEEQRRRDEEAQKAKEARKFAADSVTVEKFVAAAEARELNADVLRVIATDLAKHGADRLLQRRGLKTSNYFNEERAALKKLIAGADGKQLRGILVELMLWDWRVLDAEASKALGAIFKVKVQASGKDA
jgi:ParB/RepB/Spo0J family partition protein